MTFTPNTIPLQIRSDKDTVNDSPANLVLTYPLNNDFDLSKDFLEITVPAVNVDYQADKDELKGGMKPLHKPDVDGTGTKLSVSVKWVSTNPGPSTFSYEVTVPADSSLSFSPRTL